MDISFNLNTVYKLSESIVVRELEGEILIIPVFPETDGIDGAVYSLNHTGRKIWHKIDGLKNVKNIVQELLTEFEIPEDILMADVISLLNELLRRKILFVVA